jgi:zinc D-Ala-D-Ala carboxypeptidase
MMLSAQYELLEFVRSTTAVRRGIDNTPSAIVIENLKLLAAELEKVCALVECKLLIHSGYRSPALNHAVGGSEPPQSPLSYHVFGLAADFDPPPNCTHDELQQAIAAEPSIAFDLVLEERARDGAHWLHFQIAKPGALPRRKVRDAELDRQGGVITRVSVG